MLVRRLISAAIIVFFMLLLILLDFQLGTDHWMGKPGIVVSIVAILVSAMAAEELLFLLRQRQPDLQLVVPCIATAIMVACCCIPVLWRDYPADCRVGFFGWSMFGLTVAFGLMWLGEIQAFMPDGNATDRITKYGFMFLYLVLPFSFLIAHRLLDSDNALGLISLITLISTVKMSDACAYFVGKSLGRTKMSPSISPGKTIEGAIGSLFGAWLAAAIVLYLVCPFVFGVSTPKPVWWFLVYGAAITVAGIIGDLAESIIKRDAHYKDSSKWLPGLGGVLDVTDSLVLAAPVSYFLWVLD